MSSTATTSRSPYSISVGSSWKTEEQVEELRTELKNFLKVVKGNPQRFFALCDFAGISGHNLDPESCDPVPKETVQRILHDALAIVLDGPKIDGKTNGFSVGQLGSRWLDMKASDYGVHYIRLAFYSKKSYGGKPWDMEKPYALHATIERAKGRA